MDVQWIGSLILFMFLSKFIHFSFPFHSFLVIFVGLSCISKILKFVILQWALVSLETHSSWKAYDSQCEIHDMQFYKFVLWNH